jgi:coproporphyrinogen III oxidase-like Fe-S oxidoreductase
MIPADYIAEVRRAGRDPALPPGGATPRILATPEEVASLPWVERVDVLTEQESLAETIILGLRLREGVDLNLLAEQLQSDPTAFDDRYRDLVAAGLLWYDNGRIGLTARGRLLGNEVFIRFLPPARAPKM